MADSTSFSQPTGSPTSSGRLVLSACVGLGFATILAAFFLNLWRIPEYEFFPQALLGAAFLAWLRAREVAHPLAPAEGPLASLGLLAALGILLVAVVFWSPWLGAIASLLAAASLLYAYGGKHLLGKMAPALVMVVTIIPPPLGLGDRLTLWLRSVATVLSSRVLDMLGIVHAVSGNLIDLPQRRLLVEEACSAINSVVFVTSFTVFFLLWQRRRAPAFFVCIPIMLIFVVAGNIFRISLGAWILVHSGIDLLTGWKHELLSIVLVALYILLAVSLDHLLFGAARPAPDPTTPSPPAKPWFAWRPVSAALCLGFAAAGLLGGFQGWKKWTAIPTGLQASESHAPASHTFTMPDQLGDWTRLEGPAPTLNKIETLNLTSALWTFQFRGLTAVVAFDFPIWGYHDVDACYTGAGWKILAKDKLRVAPEAPVAVRMDLSKDPSASATVWFATLSERGDWMEESNFRRDLAARLRDLGGVPETSYRIQVFVASDHPLGPAERSAAEQLFTAASRIFEQQILSLNKHP